MKLEGKPSNHCLLVGGASKRVVVGMCEICVDYTLLVTDNASKLTPIMAESPKYAATQHTGHHNTIVSLIALWEVSHTADMIAQRLSVTRTQLRNWSDINDQFGCVAVRSSVGAMSARCQRSRGKLISHITYHQPDIFTISS